MIGSQEKQGSIPKHRWKTGGGMPEHAPRSGAAFEASQPFSTLPPFSKHCFSLIDIHPWPLQAFFPLHPFLADEHSLLPLHELTPAHCTLASVLSAAVTPTVPDRNNPAAATASAAPETALIVFLFRSSIFHSLSCLVEDTTLLKCFSLHQKLAERQGDFLANKVARSLPRTNIKDRTPLHG
jgi:hypothetical protein